MEFYIEGVKKNERRWRYLRQLKLFYDSTIARNFYSLPKYLPIYS